MLSRLITDLEILFNGPEGMPESYCNGVRREWEELDIVYPVAVVRESASHRQCARLPPSVR